MIHAVNERLQSGLQARGRDLPRWLRPLVAIAFLSMGVAVSTFGLIQLVAKGYGTVSWGFFFVYIFPLMTFGLYKTIKKGRGGNRVTR